MGNKQRLQDALRGPESELRRGTGYNVGLAALPQQTELPERAGALPEPLQVIARQYIGARRKSGEALLDSCRWLSEARQIAKHGEWKIFLEATGTSDDTAERLLNIHAQAMQNPQFADFVRTQWIGQSAAALLAAPSTPPQIIDQVLDSPEPPTVADIKSAIKEAKQATSMEQAFPLSLRKRAKKLGAQISTTFDITRQLAAVWLPGEPSSRWMSVAELAAWCDAPPTPAPAPAPIDTDDAAIIAEIRAKAGAFGLGVIWEGDEVIIHWPDENIETLLGMGYQDALHWLATEAPAQAKRRSATPSGPAATYEAAEKSDLSLIAEANAAGVAPDPARIQVAQWQAEQDMIDRTLHMVPPDLYDANLSLILEKAGWIIVLRGPGTTLTPNHYRTAEAAIRFARENLMPPAPNSEAARIMSTPWPPPPTRPRRPRPPVSYDESACLSYIAQLEEYATQLEALVEALT